MPVVLRVLLGVSLVTLVPLVVDKVWKCKEEERMMEQDDRGMRIYYPDHMNAHWEYTKKTDTVGDTYEWEDVGLI